MLRAFSALSTVSPCDSEDDEAVPSPSVLSPAMTTPALSAEKEGARNDDDRSGDEGGLSAAGLIIPLGLEILLGLPEDKLGLPREARG